MKKGIIVLLILSLLFGATAMAQEITSVENAASFTESIMYYFHEKVNQTADEDTQLATALCLEEVETVLLTLLSADQEKFQHSSEEDGTEAVIVKALEIDGYMYDCTLRYNNNYLWAEYELQHEGKVAQHVIVEAGRRADSDEAVMMLLKYEDAGILTNTNRILVKTEDADCSYLFVRTLGEVFDVSFHVSDWMAGQEYEWENALLFP